MASNVDSRPAPRHARPFVALFLAALVVCALAAWNVWPFPAWELFSRLRSDRQSDWQAAAVERAGREHDYPIGSMGHGSRGFAFLMAGFGKRSAADRNAICAAWLHAANGHTQLLRIYRLEWLLSDREGSRAAQPRRTLAWTCSKNGARPAGQGAPSPD